MSLAKSLTAVFVSLGIPVLAMVEPEGTPPAGVAAVEPEHRESVLPSSAAPPNPAAAAFGATIARLSDEAEGIDRLWQAYQSQCPSEGRDRTYDGFGREWFEVLDAPGDTVGSPECADLRRLIRQSGSGVRDDLRQAIAVARGERLDQATLVGLLRWNSLELP